MTRPQRKWTVAACEEADCPQLAYISWTSFENSEVNGYLRPLHLRPRNPTEQQKTDTAAKRILGGVRNPKHLMVKVVDPEHPEAIAGFAVWAFSENPDETTKVEDVPDESTRDETVDYEASKRFKTSLQANAREVMGGRRHLNLIGIATHPGYLRQGVASAILDWGIKEANKEQVPVLIESVPHARAVYLSKGFAEIGKWTLDYDDKDMQGKPTGETKTITLYMMTREPDQSR
ncbi:hypothetical protein P389DRAFT_192061 [Cystobasidium minutum MCA 4210]|uniref:uncharacterized protein n=1 Tax=Cystobasidium minutum MCA 4210 TaxID=1397322 RepID=UPI0034CDA02A|eukprot:jgi/Rhomi1/192061/gm1.275_g